MLGGGFSSSGDFDPCSSSSSRKKPSSLLLLLEGDEHAVTNICSDRDLPQIQLTRRQIQYVRVGAVQTLLHANTARVQKSEITWMRNRTHTSNLNAHARPMEQTCPRYWKEKTRAQTLWHIQTSHTFWKLLKGFRWRAATLWHQVTTNTVCLHLFSFQSMTNPLIKKQ